jgi:flagellar biogenesis protein FliO
MPEPIRVTALARNATGLEQLWIGIATAIAGVVLLLILLIWLVMRLLQWAGRA